MPAGHQGPEEDSVFPIASEKSCTLLQNSGCGTPVSPQIPQLLTICVMREHTIRNLTSLSPVDEFLARVAISAPGEDRLRLGLPAVVDGPDEHALVIQPDSPDPEANSAAERS